MSRVELGPPFTFHITVGTLVLMKVVADVGVNFRNLLHMRSEMVLAPQETEAGVEYRLHARLADIAILRGDRVVLVTESRLTDPQGRRILGYRDFFVILNLEPEQVEALRASKGFGNFDISELRDAARRRSKLLPKSGVQRKSVTVADDMGVRYGRVAGDLNPVHTTAMAARLFGYKRPFVQGLCTANYLLVALTSALPVPLQQFRITFSQPVFTGQPFDILFTDRAFEVLDEQSAVLAHGQFDRVAAHGTDPG